MGTNRSRQKHINEMNQEASEYQRERNSNKRHRLTKDQLLKNGIELNQKQNELYKGIRNNILTVCQGPSGTSKTFTACYTSLALLADKKIDKIVLTKPLQTSGEDVGFLKGTLSEKINPFMQSYFSNFEKILGKEVFEFMIATGEIQVETLAYMRGTTFDNSIMLIDEAQNCTMSQIILWVTRLGKDSKGIIMGDVSQYDIKKRDSQFLEFIELIGDVESVFKFEFTSKDIVRNRFLINVVERYEKWKSVKEDKLNSST